MEILIHMQTSIVILGPIRCRRKHLANLGLRTSYYLRSQKYVRFGDYWV